MEKLSQDQVDAKTDAIPDWALAGESLQRTITFDDFVQAMGFVNRVADLAEQLQHHPDILVRYNKVTLTVTTHDAGGLTEKDFDFATKCDPLVTA